VDDSNRKALTLGRGASFAVTHVCPDGRPTDLYWANEDYLERTWLQCPRCLYAVQLVTRTPEGKVNAPAERPAPPPDPGPCPECGWVVGDVMGHLVEGHPELVRQANPSLGRLIGKR
jgi:hypothetical protein